MHAISDRYTVPTCLMCSQKRHMVNVHRASIDHAAFRATRTAGANRADSPAACAFRRLLAWPPIEAALITHAVSLHGIGCIWAAPRLLAKVT